MRKAPANKLDPRIRIVWRVSDGALATLVFAIMALPLLLLAVAGAGMWAVVMASVLVVAYAVALVVLLVVLPPIRYARWRYEFTPEYLDIARGIVWRRRSIVPFVRVQNTDTRQGPIMRAVGLASVTVSTAAGSHEIPGLRVEEANRLRDLAAEFARLAREDV